MSNIQLSLNLLLTRLLLRNSIAPTREQTNVSEIPASIELLEWRLYQEIIMVAQLWFGMCNIQPRLPSCLRREVQ